MVDGYSHNNPLDATKKRFVKLEEKFVDISCNMALVMVALENNFGTFGEIGIYNLEVGSDEKPRDSKDP
jgi:hypothetical protein